ncbi:MAG: BON domain-containing protein [Ardenticatenaceae bacterium]
MAVVRSQPTIHQKGDQKGFRCPVCKAQVTNVRVCPECKEDLTPMLLVHNLAPSHYNEGLRLAQEGNIQQAIEQLQTALVIEPSHLDSLIVLGKLHAQQGCYREAIGYWKRALELDPENAKAKEGILKAQARQQPIRRSRRLPLVLLLVALMLLSGLLGWFLLPSTGNNNEIPPTQSAQIAPLVKTAFQNDQKLNQFDLAVEQMDSVIYLSGNVPTSELKKRAETVAKEVDGVAAVDSSNVAVVPPPLAQAVLQALANEPQLAASTITVEQINHDIHLNGHVNHPDLKALVEETVDRVPNVGLIDSRKLLVMRAPLAEEVQEALQGDQRTKELGIQVNSVENSVRLEGNVPDLATKSTVQSVVLTIAGAQLIDTSGLEVQEQGVKAVEPPAAQHINYIVRPGDTLSSLADSFYRDPAKFSLIYQANQDKIPNPNLIRVGTPLLIPLNSD